MKIIFCSLSILLFCSLFQSCFTYTAGYDTIGNGYFEKYSQDSTYYYERMQRFGFEHNNLMLDSGYVNKYFKNKDFSVSERRKVFSMQKLYPLYPLTTSFGLNIWYIKSRQKDVIFELGLFNCKFNNLKYNQCGLFIYSIMEASEDKVYGSYELIKNSSEGRRLRKYYIKRFEEEIIPLMKPYFEEYKKRKQ